MSCRPEQQHQRIQATKEEEEEATSSLMNCTPLQKVELCVYNCYYRGITALSSLYAKIIKNKTAQDTEEPFPPPGGILIKSYEFKKIFKMVKIKKCDQMKIK